MSILRLYSSGCFFICFSLSLFFLQFFHTFEVDYCSIDVVLLRDSVALFCFVFIFTSNLYPRSSCFILSIDIFVPQERSHSVSHLKAFHSESLRRIISKEATVSQVSVQIGYHFNSNHMVLYLSILTEIKKRERNKEKNHVVESFLNLN